MRARLLIIVALIACLIGLWQAGLLTRRNGREARPVAQRPLNNPLITVADTKTDQTPKVLSQADQVALAAMIDSRWRVSRAARVQLQLSAADEAVLQQHVEDLKVALFELERLHAINVSRSESETVFTIAPFPAEAAQVGQAFERALLESFGNARAREMLGAGSPSTAERLATFGTHEMHVEISSTPHAYSVVRDTVHPDRRILESESFVFSRIAPADRKQFASRYGWLYESVN